MDKYYQYHVLCYFLFLFINSCGSNEESLGENNNTISSQKYQMDDTTHEVQEVMIGNQVWDKSDFNGIQTLSGKEIFFAKSEEDWRVLCDEGKLAYCYYGFDKKNARFGKIYNTAILNFADSLIEGWRIPTNEEFDELDSIIGGARNRILLCDSSTWVFLNSKDIYGFSAKAGGQLCIPKSDKITFDGLGRGVSYWNTSELEFRMSRHSWFIHDGSNLHYHSIENKFDHLRGCYIRLIKD